MPKIDDLTIKKQSKQFQKVAYRPWETDFAKTQGDKTNFVDENIQSKLDVEISPVIKSSNEMPSIHEKSLKSLYGLQKNIITFLSSKVKHVDNDFAYTSYLEISEIIKFTRSTRGAVASSLTRLKQKKFILTHENKPGRGGYSCYKMRKDFFNFIKSIT